MTNEQAALLPNERLRVRAEQLRALYGMILDDVSNFVGELSDYFTVENSLWIDTRSDVPHNLSAADIVAFEALEKALLGSFTPETLALIAKFCVRPVLTS